MKQRNIIIGGGIIGLSIAYELANRGEHVVLIERGRCGTKASWAGAGILVPTNSETAIHPLEQLEALSHAVHKQWSEQLHDQTGIDNGFRQCGGLYLARTPGEVAALTGVRAEWVERGIEHQVLDASDLDERSHPCLETFNNIASPSQIVWVPGEAQFSNPDHLEALKTACHEMGVSIQEDVGETQLEMAGGKLISVSTPEQSFEGENYFLTGGPWTEQLARPLELPLPMQPVKGQIALYKLDAVRDTTIANGPIVNEGSRYLVPRRDGHVLAGSTIEEVGFDCQATEAEISDLRNWAESLTSRLNDETFVKAWAGLRPATYDGFPYIGRLGDRDNVFVATGHFKGGLHLSTGTAVVMADLAQGKSPTIDVRFFSPSRAADHHSTEIR